MLKAEYQPYTLRFKFTAHTSRETFVEKTTYVLSVCDDRCPDIVGRGEVAVFPSLMPSYNSIAEFEALLDDVCCHVDEYANGRPLPENSAIRFGFESAIGDLAHGGRGYVFGKDILGSISDGIRINGLVWMNDRATMERQISEKLAEGFRCLKLKIGAIDFDDEVQMIANVRSAFPENVLQIRLDANGAFNEKDALQRLDRLARYDIHSIEQPIPRDSAGMAMLCRESPIPIALDEDMIERWWPSEQKAEWLAKINPAYIILKPSLVGGFEAADTWIDIADALGIGWWATSALESGLGLSAIAQWLATHPDNLDIPHGLGTGEIYANNLPGLAYRQGERLFVRQL